MDAVEICSSVCSSRDQSGSCFFVRSDALAICASNFDDHGLVRSRDRRSEFLDDTPKLGAGLGAHYLSTVSSSHRAVSRCLQRPSNALDQTIEVPTLRLRMPSSHGFVCKHLRLRDCLRHARELRGSIANDNASIDNRDPAGNRVSNAAYIRGGISGAGRDRERLVSDAQNCICDFPDRLSDLGEIRAG